jgi:hypothetical protein
MTRGGHIPSPFDRTLSGLGFFTEHADAVRLSAFLQLGAAIVLGLFTATAVSRLRFLGVQAAGGTIAAFGGFAGAVFSALAALLAWVLAAPDDSGLPAQEGFHWLMFGAGGPATVATMGLLVAGVSVSGGLSGLLPRWLGWAGVALAAVAELSTLVLVVPSAVYLLPIARLLTLAWMITVGAVLPRSRNVEVRASPEPEPAALHTAHQH